jgi:integrase
MSKAKRGEKFTVRWREGGRHRQRTFDRAGDRDAFETDLRRRKQLGALAPEVIQSRMTLAEFMEDEWWPRYAIPNLAEDTRRRYLEVWGTHILHRIGGYELQDITPMLVEDYLEQLTRAGVGKPTQRKALMMLQAILRRAVVRRLILTNPVGDVMKPKQPPTAPPRPLAPETVELIREYLLTKTWTSPKRGSGRSPADLQRYRHRNATIVSLMAYAGLRPSEDRSSTWGDLNGRALHVVATKTNSSRTVDLLAPLVQDLAEWRLISGRPADSKLIVPRVDGKPWGREDWGNWRQRVWRPAAIACGVTGDLRPYRLRGSFVSLLLWEGRSLAYVAEQSGHSIATLALSRRKRIVNAGTRRPAKAIARRHPQASQSHRTQAFPHVLTPATDQTGPRWPSWCAHHVRAGGVS